MVASARRAQYHTRSFVCPLCGGHRDLPRGKGVRCSGWTDGDYTHCSREEYAGSLPEEGGGTYCHHMVGDCRCGRDHGGPRPLAISTGYTPRRGARATGERKGPVVATYDYRDEEGTLLWEKDRHEPKTFTIRRPDGRGGCLYNREGVDPVPFRLPQLLAAPVNAIIIINEGEQGTLACVAHGLVATNAPDGAGSWQDDFAAYLHDRIAVVIADHDEKGRQYAATVAASLAGIAAAVYVVEFTDLPEKSDAHDFFAAGGTVADLFSRVLRAGPALAAGRADIDRDLEAVKNELAREKHQHRLQQQALLTLCRDTSQEQTMKLAKIAFNLAIEVDPEWMKARTATIDSPRQFVASLIGAADPATGAKILAMLKQDGLATVSTRRGDRPVTAGGFKPEIYTLKAGANENGVPFTVIQRLRLSTSTTCDKARRKKRGPKPGSVRRCPQHPNAPTRLESYCGACHQHLGTDTIPGEAPEFTPRFVGDGPRPAGIDSPPKKERAGNQSPSVGVCRNCGGSAAIGKTFCATCAGARFAEWRSAMRDIPDEPPPPVGNQSPPSADAPTEHCGVKLRGSPQCHICGRAVPS
jgi:hypothetical protein